MPDAAQSEPGRAVITVNCEAICTFAGRTIEQDAPGTADAAVVLIAAKVASATAMALSGLNMVGPFAVGSCIRRCPDVRPNYGRMLDQRWAVPATATGPVR